MRHHSFVRSAMIMGAVSATAACGGAVSRMAGGQDDTGVPTLALTIGADTTVMFPQSLGAEPCSAETAAPLIGEATPTTQCLLVPTRRMTALRGALSEGFQAAGWALARAEPAFDEFRRPSEKIVVTELSRRTAGAGQSASSAQNGPRRGQSVVLIVRTPAD